MVKIRLYNRLCELKHKTCISMRHRCKLMRQTKMVSKMANESLRNFITRVGGWGSLGRRCCQSRVEIKSKKHCLQYQAVDWLKILWSQHSRRFEWLAIQCGQCQRRTNYWSWWSSISRLRKFWYPSYFLFIFTVTLFITFAPHRTQLVSYRERHTPEVYVCVHCAVNSIPP